MLSCGSQLCLTDERVPAWPTDRAGGELNLRSYSGAAEIRPGLVGQDAEMQRLEGTIER